VLTRRCNLRKLSNLLVRQRRRERDRNREGERDRARARTRARARDIERASKSEKEIDEIFTAVSNRYLLKSGVRQVCFKDLLFFAKLFHAPIPIAFFLFLTHLFSVQT
jgi:hypothetical protein